MTTPTNQQLREFILASFNESELGLFCFDHFEEAEHYFSDNMSLLDRTLALIKYCKRQGQIAALLRALEQERPSTYPQAFAAPPKPVATETSTPKPQASKPQSEPIQQLDLEQDTFIHEKTGLEFVRIPVGEFLYGGDLKPIHLPEYWISKTPVTNGVYKKFIDANPLHPVPKVFLGGEANWDKKHRAFTPGKADHPVSVVNWYDAITFCQWAGLQLPTDEQWEKAARGTDGRVYPWGNSEPKSELCNFNNKMGNTTPVGQYSPQGDNV